MKLSHRHAARWSRGRKPRPEGRRGEGKSSPIGGGGGGAPSAPAAPEEEASGGGEGDGEPSQSNPAFDDVLDRLGREEEEYEATAARAAAKEARNPYKRSRVVRRSEEMKARERKKPRTMSRTGSGTESGSGSSNNSNKSDSGADGNEADKSTEYSHFAEQSAAEAEAVEEGEEAVEEGEEAEEVVFH